MLVGWLVEQVEVIISGLVYCMKTRAGQAWSGLSLAKSQTICLVKICGEKCPVNKFIMDY